MTHHSIPTITTVMEPPRSRERVSITPGKGTGSKDFNVNYITIHFLFFCNNQIETNNEFLIRLLRFH